MVLPIRGEGLLKNFLGRYVLPRLSKVLGSPEMFFWLETGVSGMNFRVIMFRDSSVTFAARMR